MHVTSPNPDRGFNSSTAVVGDFIPTSRTGLRKIVEDDEALRKSKAIKTQVVMHSEGFSTSSRHVPEITNFYMSGRQLVRFDPEKLPNCKRS